MNTPTPDNIREFFEEAAKANLDAWNAQASYFDGLLKRNTKAFTTLADARMASFKEMSEAKTFNQAFEANLAFEDLFSEELQGLQENNTKAWEALMDNLKAVYTPVTEAAKQPKKTAVKKAA